jgi:hypothetical protein
MNIAGADLEVKGTKANRQTIGGVINESFYGGLDNEQNSGMGLL